MEQIKITLRQFRDLFLKMNGSQQLSIVAFGLAILILLGVFVNSAMEPQKEQVLFWNISYGEAGEIVQKLKDIGEEPEVREGVLLVGADADINKLYMMLAQEDLLPENMEFNFMKMIEQTNFTHTNQERTNMKNIALMNEIAKGLTGNDDILEAKVLIADAEPSPLLRTHIPRTASVRLKVRGGRELSMEEVKGIIAWVSSAATGLDPNNVTIIDSKNRPYSLEMGAGGANKLEMKWKAEKYYAREIESLLSEFIPRARATVSLSLDLSQRRKEVKDYQHNDLNKNGSSVLLNNVQEKENSDSKEGSQGVTGAGTNSAAEIKEGDGGVNMSTARNMKQEGFDSSVVQEFITYDGMKMLFKGISVVVVDKKLNLNFDESLDISEENPRYLQAEWLSGNASTGNSLKELIAGVVGIENSELVKISQQSMQMPSIARKPGSIETFWGSIVSNGYLLLMAFLSLAGAFLLVRMIRNAQPEEEILEMPTFEEEKGADLPPLQEPEADPKVVQIENRVKELIDDDPQKAASLIRHWMTSE